MKDRYFLHNDGSPRMFPWILRRLFLLDDYTVYRVQEWVRYIIALAFLLFSAYVTFNALIWACERIGL